MKKPFLVISVCVLVFLSVLVILQHVPEKADQAQQEFETNRQIVMEEIEKSISESDTEDTEKQEDKKDAFPVFEPINNESFSIDILGDIELHGDLPVPFYNKEKALAAAKERKELEKNRYWNHSEVTRHGDCMHIFFESGEEREYCSLLSSDAGSTKDLIGFLGYTEGLGYIIGRQLHEGYQYTLISNINGEEFELSGMPVVSPNGDRFFTLSHTDFLFYSEGTLGMLVYEKDELGVPVEMFRTVGDGRKWQILSGEWMDNDKIALTLEFSDPNYVFMSSSYRATAVMEIK